jgi:hypothetical protein
MKSWAYPICTHIGSCISIHMKLHIHMQSCIQRAHKHIAWQKFLVFSLPEIRYLDKVSFMVNKSGVLQNATLIILHYLRFKI